MRKIFFALSFLVSGFSYSQNIFEDQAGETTLNFAKDYYFFRFNTSETAIKLGAVFKENEPYETKLFNRDWGKFINANVKFASTEGLATLYEGGKFNFAYAINLKPGIVRQWSVNDKSSFFQIFLDLNLGKATYKIADSTQVEGFNKTQFNPTKFTLNLNYVVSEKWFFGIASGYAHQNNVDEMSDGEVTKEYFSNSGLQISNLTGVKIGEYKTKDAFRLDADVAFLPNWFENQIGFTIYERSAFADAQNRCDAGFGIFILPKTSDDPSYSSIGGIGFTFRDIGNSQSSEKGVVERGILYLFAGFKLPSN